MPNLICKVASEGTSLGNKKLEEKEIQSMF
jgi:hypothetical protein